MTSATKSPPKTTDLAFQRFRLADLEGASYNPRAISSSAYQGLRDSLKEFGLLEVPVVNTHEGGKRLVSGHQRVQAMIEDGVEFADCLAVELDPTAERVANLTMNNPAIRGTYDPVEALKHLPDIERDLPRPDFAGFDAQATWLREWAGRLTTMRGPGATDEGEGGKDTVSSKPKSKVGTIYKLGRHRIYCGSYEAGLPLMLGKRKAVACVTDPPYNVDYENRDGEVVEGDKMSPKAFAAFVREMSETIIKHTKGPSYIFMSSKELPTLQRAWEAANGSVVRWLYWCKERFVLGLADYRSQHEPIMVGVKAGTDFEAGESLTTVVEALRTVTNPLHPTQKPTTIMRKLLEDCTQQGDLVIDPFVGSGTSLVVAEELGLTCFACELEPCYVDVVRQRYAAQMAGEVETPEYKKAGKTPRNVTPTNWAKMTPAIKK